MTRRWTARRTLHSIAATVCVMSAALIAAVAAWSTIPTWAALPALATGVFAAETISRTAGRR